MKLRFTRRDLIIFICYWIIVFFVRIAFNQDSYKLTTEELILSNIFTFVIDNITVFIIIYTLTGIFFGDRPWLMALNFLAIFFLSVLYMVFYEVLINNRYEITIQKILGGIMNHGRSYFILASVFSVRTIRRFDRDRIRLLNEKYEEEKKSMRARVTPHVVLNALSLFTQKTKRYSNEQVISMIRPLLYYVLYDCQRDWIPLEKEISFLEDYIEMQRQQLPFPEILDVRIGVSKEELRICPGILLSYIENVFKHGGKAIDDTIKIELYVQSGMIYLLTSNTSSPINDDKRNGKGIGMADSQRSLELNYPDRHALFAGTEGKYHNVQLSIKLDKL